MKDMKKYGMLRNEHCQARLQHPKRNYQTTAGKDCFSYSWEIRNEKLGIITNDRFMV